MRILLGLLPFLLLSTTPALGGARIHFDLNRATALLEAEMVYFGDIREEELLSATRIIAKQWQGEPTRPGDTSLLPLYLVFKGQLRISTRITARFLPDLETAKIEASRNRDPHRNYFRVLPGPTRTFPSSVTREAINSGFFLYSDSLGSSTTAPHEFGHTLGLDHIRAVRGLPGPPPIMLDRGSVPNDPAYSYEPNVPLSPVNPVFRRVTQTDLNAIDLRGAIEYREDDPARYSSKSLAKIVYTNSGRTEGFIDLGFWTLITPENPLFSARP